MSISMQEALRSAQRAARTAGALLLRMQADVRPREKGPKDLVTEADLAAQQAIQAHLAQDFPGVPFVGEEDETCEDSARLASDGYCWIVDPLDGTTNYVHGMDNFSVSIALRSGNTILLGVIYDPARDHLYWALAGQGAFRNEQRIAVSRVTALREALVAASFPARVIPESPEIARFTRVLCQCQALRRLGSAALNLGYVAAGQLDGYWATSVKLWDVAAGLLLVTEAGGTATAIDGTPLLLDRPQFVAASTVELHQELLRELNEAVTADGHP